jgi:NAD+ diphosphatase
VSDPARRELYGRLPLARGTVDRAAEHRVDRAWLARRWTSPGARVLVVDDQRVAANDDRSGLRWLDPTDVKASPDDAYLLGIDGDETFFAVPAVAERLHPAGGSVATATLRELGPQLDDREAGLAVHAVGLANWHAAHGHCSRCGAPTYVSDGGHVRRCPADGSQHFPRTDPAVIVLVTDDDDRALLGHNGASPANRYSTLAGFVEPGESLEAAVAREVREEVGVEVADVTYAGSQPWPFPSSLMVGFFARGRSHRIRVDGEEITDARWFSRDELAALAASGDVLLPSPVSIARLLVEGWYGGAIATAREW